jgi:hypothetical protein
MIGISMQRAASVLIVLALILSALHVSMAFAEPGVSLHDMAGMRDCRDCASHNHAGLANTCGALCAIAAPAVLPLPLVFTSARGSGARLFDEPRVDSGAFAPDPKPPFSGKAQSIS